MDLLTCFFIAVLCAFAYILGQRSRDQESRTGSVSQPISQKSSYQKLRENHDEESLVDRPEKSNKSSNNSSTTTSNSNSFASNKTSENTLEIEAKNGIIADQQKEIDRLMRDLTDFKKREQKNQAEISYLKTKITLPAQSVASHKLQSDDLMTDQGFTDLLDEASHDNHRDELEFDEDELNKQIEQQLI